MLIETPNFLTEEPPARSCHQVGWEKAFFEEILKTDGKYHRKEHEILMKIEE